MMMKMLFNKKYTTMFLLLIVIFIAIFFRGFNFPKNPPSLNWDEVSIGYNAYSILKTGRDEFGNKMPLYFRSLDDYKQPVQVYITTVSESIFGYNDFAVRFPSLVFGIFGVILLYLFVLELFNKKNVALISAFIYAILPWTVTFSRFSLEANTALSLLILGMYLFLKSLKTKKWLLPVSIIIFTIASYSYLSYKVVIPLIIFSLFLIYRKSINLKDKYFLISVLIVGFFLLLTARDSLSSRGQVRLQGTSIINQESTFKHELLEMQTEGSLNINLPRKFFHEIPVFTNAGLISRGYLTHFSPDFLFFDLGQKLHLTPNVGLLFLWMLPFILLGGFILFKNDYGKGKFLILALILIAPIPASVTYDIPHAIRSYALVIPLTVITAVGIIEIYLYLKKYIYLQKLFAICLSIIIFIFAWQFFRQYQIHLPVERSQNWQYGRKEMTKYLFENQNKYDKIIVSTNLEWPYIFMLYYSKYDPQKYLSNGGTTSGSWSEERNKFENFYFHKFNMQKEIRLNGNVLFVGKPDEFPSNVEPIKVINYLDKTPAIYFVKKESLRNKGIN